MTVKLEYYPYDDMVYVPIQATDLIQLGWRIDDEVDVSISLAGNTIRICKVNNSSKAQTNGS